MQADPAATPPQPPPASVEQVVTLCLICTVIGGLGPFGAGLCAVPALPSCPAPLCTSQPYEPVLPPRSSHLNPSLLHMVWVRLTPPPA